MQNTIKYVYIWFGYKKRLKNIPFSFPSKVLESILNL